MEPLITLLTDFGRRDHYAGVLHGVILSIAPQCRIIDLCHEVPPQDVPSGAYLLMASYSYFPPGTIHVVVVDPGVGTERRLLAARAGGHLFVGPDNGVLRWAIDRAGGHDEAVALENPAYRLPEVSATFHGRDIMAPAAAHLASGVSLSALGPDVDSLAGTPFPCPERREDVAIGEVIYVDYFGNCVTNLPAPQGRAVTEVSGLYLAVRHTYAEVAPNEPLALVGSAGLVEIAVNHGSAASRLGLTTGSPVRLHQQPSATTGLREGVRGRGAAQLSATGVPTSATGPSERDGLREGVRG